MNKTIKFTKGETNLISKYNLNQFDSAALPNAPNFNRFSGEVTLLNQFGANLFTCINLQYSKYETGDMKAVRDYDRLRYLFMKLFPKEYMILID
jgi:hypothetical protein